MKLLFIILFSLGCSLSSISQLSDIDSLLSTSETRQKLYTTNAFKSPRVINSHSIEFLPKGTLDFRILHRFGSLKDGVSNFFGLDQASMRMSFDYGITNNITVGVGRSTYKKELDGFIKYGLLRQRDDVQNRKFSVVLVSGLTVNTLPWADPTKQNYSTSRIAYYHQIIVGRKFNRHLTLQVAPTLVHTNLVDYSYMKNDQLSIQFGGRYKFSNRVAFMIDYSYVLVDKQLYGIKDPLSIGFDIETGGHIFQLHFSNSLGMNERAFLTETKQSWGKGEIQFGFNLSRVFQIKKNKQLHY